MNKTLPKTVSSAPFLGPPAMKLQFYPTCFSYTVASSELMSNPVWEIPKSSRKVNIGINV